MGAVGIRIRKTPRAFSEFLGGRKNLALAWKRWGTSVCALRFSGRAEDGEGVGYLQAVISEAETASGAPAFGAGRFTLTGGGELPAAA